MQMRGYSEDDVIRILRFLTTKPDDEEDIKKYWRDRWAFGGIRNRLDFLICKEAVSLLFVQHFVYHILYNCEMISYLHILSALCQYCV